VTHSYLPPQAMVARVPPDPTSESPRRVAACLYTSGRLHVREVLSKPGQFVSRIARARWWCERDFRPCDRRKKPAPAGGRHDSGTFPLRSSAKLRSRDTEQDTRAAHPRRSILTGRVCRRSRSWPGRGSPVGAGQAWFARICGLIAVQIAIAQGGIVSHRFEIHAAIAPKRCGRF
jgi:hypothetical protein